MSAGALEPETCDSALAAMLNRFPGAILVALDDTSTRVPLPESDRFRGFPTLPGQECTFVDVVVPADRMVVVATWERARLDGLAQGVVRTLSDPEQELRLAFIDVRHSHGVWIGILVSTGQSRTHEQGPGLDASLLAPRRPRTAVMYKNLFAIITDVDDQAPLMFGWSRQEMIGHRSLEFMHPGDHERAVAQWLEMRARRQSQRVRLRHLHRDGSWVWVEIENRFVGLDDADETVVAAHLTDISDEMAAHEAVRQRERLFHRLAESLPLGLFVVALDRRVLYANSRLATILGVPNAVMLADQLATVVDRDRPPLDLAFAATLDEGYDQEAEIEICLPPTGEIRRCLITTAALSDEEGLPGAIVSVTDITDSVRIREELTVRATFDALTGCHNRASAMTALEQALDASGGRSTAVIFIDLDKFKPINDTYGHVVGDALLVAVARRLTSVLRDQDSVGRIGGDEFLIICPGIDDPAHALLVGQRVREKLHGTVQLAGHPIDVAGSIGIAVSTATSSSDQLVAQADAAMYESKRLGDGTPVLFTDQPNPHRHHDPQPHPPSTITLSRPGG
ncbi:MAG TPA: diguanylate cyclase [Dermatophilaceae bacterium]